MSVESLVDKIIADTKRTSSEIEKRASDEARAGEKETEKNVQQIMGEAKERAARLAGERRQRMIAMAELEDRKEVLRVKQELIEEAFRRAIEKILSFDVEAYGAFLVELILKAEPEGDEEILLNRKDRDRFGNGWIKQLNQRVGKTKKKGKMRVSEETRSIQGGAILRSGRKEINCSLESVILSKRADMEATVAGILFRDSD
jgi:V/A-type H+-transporting ATPase subunit E